MIQVLQFETLLMHHLTLLFMPQQQMQRMELYTVVGDGSQMTASLCVPFDTRLRVYSGTAPHLFVKVETMISVDCNLKVHVFSN